MILVLKQLAEQSGFVTIEATVVRAGVEVDARATVALPRSAVVLAKLLRRAHCPGQRLHSNLDAAWDPEFVRARVATMIGQALAPFGLSLPPLSRLALVVEGPDIEQIPWELAFPGVEVVNALHSEPAPIRTWSGVRSVLIVIASQRMPFHQNHAETSAQDLVRCLARWVGTGVRIHVAGAERLRPIALGTAAEFTTIENPADLAQLAGQKFDVVILLGHSDGDDPVMSASAICFERLDGQIAIPVAQVADALAPFEPWLLVAGVCYAGRAFAAQLLRVAPAVIAPNLSLMPQQAVLFCDLLVGIMVQRACTPGEALVRLRQLMRELAIESPFGRFAASDWGPQLFVAA